MIPSFLRHLAAWLLAACLITTPAHAQDGEEQTSADAFDAAFGEYVVGPLATVMFFDVVFWDDHLEGQAAIGAETEDGVVTEFNPAKGYGVRLQTVAAISDLVLDFEGTKELSWGPVVADARVVTEGATPRLVGAVRAEPKAGFDPTTLNLPGKPAEGEAEAAPVVLAKAAPFPVRFDPNTQGFVPEEVTLAPTELAISVGDRVRHGSRIAEVLELGGGEAKLRSIEPKWRMSAPANPEAISFPIVVAWLVFGAIFFTLRMQFINLRGFAHAVRVTSGHFDDEDHPGEISHFQALSSALSATVGLGNIAGVAIAITLGGPGAIFWMIMAGFLGMSSKFTEVTLGQMYRTLDDNGEVSGGPMHYLRDGLREIGLSPLGTFLSTLFALMCIGGSFGGGNMFQANQSYAAIADVIPWFADHPSVYGVVLAGLVGVVIIGGIKRIGAWAGVIVPVMCGVYVLAGLVILVANAAQVPAAFAMIVSEAFSPEAGLGGMVGVIAVGFQRASFSNEAGVGSASIAHSAASTDRPVREGIVALLEPFIDTIVVCTMTGLVVVVTGVYKTSAENGVVLTSRAFETVLPWFPEVLTFAVVMFAFSTMISWSYYGERCACFLLGEQARTPYRVVFVIFVYIGSVMKLGNVLDFSDLMILGMAGPNILGCILLAGKVKDRLDRYLEDLASGAFDR